MGHGCPNACIVVICALKLGYGLLILGIALSAFVKDIEYNALKTNAKLKKQMTYALIIGCVAIVTALVGILAGVLETKLFIGLYILLLIAELVVDLLGGIYSLLYYRNDFRTGVLLSMYLVPTMACLEGIELFLALILLWRLRRSYRGTVFYSDPYALYPHNLDVRQ